MIYKVRFINQLEEKELNSMSNKKFLVHEMYVIFRTREQFIMLRCFICCIHIKIFIHIMY